MNFARDSISLPNALIVRIFLNRGLQLWIVVRLVVSGVVALAGTNPLRLSAQTSMMLVAVIVVLGLLDTRIRKERTLLGNLGISPATIPLITLAPAIMGEAIIALMAQL